MAYIQDMLGLCRFILSGKLTFVKRSPTNLIEGTPCNARGNFYEKLPIKRSKID